MEQVAKLKRTWNLGPVLQIVQRFLKTIALVYSYQLAKFGDFMSFGSKDVFKMHPVSCANTQHGVTDLVNHGMVKNTKV